MIMNMRLLRSKHSKRAEDEAPSATAASSNRAVSIPIPTGGSSRSGGTQKRHNASITSTSSSMASSVSSSVSCASYSSASSAGHHQAPPQQRHHYHQRSNSMRDHYLDMPATVEAVNLDVIDVAADVDSTGAQPIAFRQNPASVWVFPPLPPQPNLFCNTSQDAFMQFEKAGLKGFRKQFSGRFKRFVLRKPAEPAPAIPPELKCQLKTIYVY